MVAKEARLIHPGRIRLPIEGLHHNVHLAKEIEDNIRTLPGVEQVSANVRTGNVLILYKYKEVHYSNIVNELDVSKADQIIEPEDMPLNYQIIIAALPAILLAGIFIKRITGQNKKQLSDGLANIATLITLISAYPISRSGVKHIAKRGKINHDFVLSLLTFAVLSLKEGMLGLAIIFIINLTSLLQTLSIKKAHAQIAQIDPCFSGKKFNTVVAQEKVHRIAEKAEKTTLALALLTYMLTRDTQKVMAILLGANPFSISTSYNLSTATVNRQAINEHIYFTDPNILKNFQDIKHYVIACSEQFLTEHRKEIEVLHSELNKLNIKLEVITQDRQAELLEKNSEPVLYVDIDFAGRKFQIPNSITVDLGKLQDCKADVFISEKDMQQLLKAIKYSETTNKVAQQNISISLAANILAVTLAVFGLVSPINASIISSTSLIAVIANSYFSALTVKTE